MGPRINDKPWKRKLWEDVVSIDVKYRDKERTAPQICIWRRTPAGKSMSVDHDLFPSYFYIPSQDFSSIDTLESDLVPDTLEYPTIRTLDGNQVVKLNYNVFSKEQFKRARDHFKKTYEDDVKYIWRYMLDNDISFSRDRRICYFDIETDMSVDIRNTPAAVLSIAVHDDRSNVSGVLIVDKTIPRKTETVPIDEHTFIMKYKSEALLLQGFVKFIQIYNPDILCAYNLQEFDFPYLINRMRVLDINYRGLSETGNVYVIVPNEEDNEETKCYCGGRELMDWYVLFKKLYDEDKPEDYKLDTVALALLGQSKVKHEYADLSELYAKDLDHFIKYNLQDVLILKGLEEKVGLIMKYMIALQTLIPMPLESLKANSVALDFYILKTYNNKVIFPSKRNREKKRFPGAITGRFIESPTGKVTSTNPEKRMFNNVGVLDFSGMYPNIFRTFNISPEKICMNGEPDSVQIGEVSFSQAGQGLLPALVENIINLRAHYTATLKTIDPNDPYYAVVYNLQYGVKRLNNCFSGDTDIMTPRGPVNVKDLSVGDVVLSINPETRALEEKRVTHTLTEDAPDEMIRFQTTSTDMLVTRDHRILVRTHAGKTQFVKAGEFSTSNHVIPTHTGQAQRRNRGTINLAEFVDLDSYDIVVNSHEHQRTTFCALRKQGFSCRRYNQHWFSISSPRTPQAVRALHDLGFDVRLRAKRAKNCYSTHAVVSAEQFSSLLGWYLSEGSIYESSKRTYATTTRGVCRKISIAQEILKNRDIIEALLHSMDIPFYRGGGTFSFASDVYADVFMRMKCNEKKIPEDLYDLLDEPAFMHALYLGDGTKGRGFLYSTRSPFLRDQLLPMILRSGMSVRWRSEVLENGNTIYRITGTRQQSFRFHAGTVRKESYADAKVYCVTVEDNHTVLAGRGGKYTWTGQSLYGATGYSGFRLFDVRVAQSITMFGQHLITSVYKFLKHEMGYETIYQDTDSVFIPLTCDVKDRDATEAEIADIRGKVNAYIEKMVNDLGSNRNYMKMDFEERFAKLVFMGVKKRYLGTADLYKGKWLDHPKFIIKGYDLVRREMPKVAKELVRETVFGFFNDTPVEQIRENYLTKVKALRTLPLIQIAWIKGLGKNLEQYEKNVPQHVKACLAGEQQFGIKFKKGDYPRMMYIKSIPFIDTKGTSGTTDVIAFTKDTRIPKKILDAVDYNRFIKSFVVNKLEVFYGVRGMPMETVVNDNITLTDFFDKEAGKRAIDEILGTTEDEADATVVFETK